MNQLLTYGNIRLLDVRADEVQEWEVSSATHLRIQLPATTQNQLEMHKQGFFLADRTLGVSINLSRTQLDYEKLVRMEILESGNYRADILRIAKDSFTEDRRFHLLPQLDSDIAGLVLQEWVEKLDDCLICLYKGTPIGFLALKETAPETRFVHLAAVEERYRSAGAALSLYAKAVALCKERGCKRLEGRVSSRNTPVMNLYAYLGGSFGAPEDVYLKEVAPYDA